MNRAKRKRRSSKLTWPDLVNKVMKFEFRLVDGTTINCEAYISKIDTDIFTQEIEMVVQATKHGSCCIQHYGQGD